MRRDSSRLFELIQLQGSFWSCETRILLLVLCLVVQIIVGVIVDKIQTCTGVLNIQEKIQSQ